MLFLHYSKLERVNFGCSFPEHPNISKIENVREKMTKMLRCDGICTHSIPGLEKPAQELGKKWWEQGETEKQQFHI